MPADGCVYQQAFQCGFTKLLVSYISEVTDNMSPNQDSTIKLPAPTRQDMVDWIEKAHNYLLEDPDLSICKMRILSL